MAAIASSSAPSKECIWEQEVMYKSVDKGSLSQLSTDGSVVEFSPATREARVRFPVSAFFFHPFFSLTTPPTTESLFFCKTSVQKPP